jgi:alpha-L-fucosidase
MTRRTALGTLAASLVAAPLIAAPQPKLYQRKWMALRQGMFLHFGPNTIQGVGWGDGKFPPAEFRVKPDANQWAEVAQRAGMKYALLTAKHHDGFCLWPSKLTSYSVANSPSVDVVGAYVEAFRKRGIRPGLYYSLWDRNYPKYEHDAEYVEFFHGQIRELLTTYGDIVELWFDGGWDKEHPTRKWEYDPAWEKDPQSGFTRGERWKWRELYDMVRKLQPECMVLNNSSSDRPGEVRYHPVDARTVEHFDFVFRERLHKPNLRTVWTDDRGQGVYLPLEYAATLTPGWFWKKNSYVIHASAETIAEWRRRARSSEANLVINVGPNDQGRIPEYHAEFLIAAAKLA